MEKKVYITSPNIRTISPENIMILKENKKEQENLIQEMEKDLLNRILKLHPEFRDNYLLVDLLKKSNNYEFCCKLICLTSKNPIIISDYNITQEIHKYLTMSQYNIDDLNNLLKLSEKVYENINLVKLINSSLFIHIKDVLKSDILMNNENFVNYLLKNLTTKIGYGNSFNNVKLMEHALNSNLNYELVIACGNENLLKNYIIYNKNKDFFDIVAGIKIVKLRHYILSIIFNISNKNKIIILDSFFSVKEIRNQLLDKNSLYYLTLISTNSDVSKVKDFGSKESLFSYDKEMFKNYDFHKMIHYFDLFVSRYIYYYENKKINKVELIDYINSIKKKIQEYNDLQYIVYGADEIKRVQELEEKYKEKLKTSLLDLCTQALEENANKGQLTKKQMN